jgi:hypothetical protein
MKSFSDFAKDGETRKRERSGALRSGARRSGAPS